VLSAKTLVRVAIGGLKSVAEFCKTHYLPLAVSLLALITFLMVPLPAALEPTRTFVNEFSYFAAYWLILGIASSIGLGTGLHTFILYLGPHIM